MNFNDVVVVKMKTKRLNLHLNEAEIHIERLKDVLNRLKKIYPLTLERFKNLTPEEKDMLDTLAFRFSKLQDLIGSKIFREYLQEVGFIVEDKAFLELLKEIEKEGIVDIDSWSEFRKVRNILAHDYSDDLEEKAEAINYLIEKPPNLIGVIEKIESEINKQGN